MRNFDMHGKGHGRGLGRHRMGKGIVIGAVLFVVLGLLVMSLWNALLPAILGVKAIGFWQALGDPAAEPHSFRWAGFPSRYVRCAPPYARTMDEYEPRTT